MTDRRSLTTFIPLPVLIQLLRDAAHTPADHWAAISRTFDPLVRVPTAEAGPCAAVLATAARTLLLQLEHVAREAHPWMRMTLIALSDVLQAELNERGTKHSQPFYTRDNG